MGWELLGPADGLEAVLVAGPGPVRGGKVSLKTGHNKEQIGF